MNIADLEYVCALAGDLAGMPIRIYRDKGKAFYHSLVSLPKDPILPYEEKILGISNHLSYFITPYFHYYGVVNSDEYKIVLGPSGQKELSESELKELAFECDVSKDETDAFVSGMGRIVKMPLTSILQILCSFNFILNNERLTLYDLAIYDEEQSALSKQLENEEIKNDYDDISPKTEDKHNTIDIEQTLMGYIRKGDVSALREWAKRAPIIKSGTLSPDSIRQGKNTFIVSATLASREAIRGGLDAEEALSLSDAYIQKCELLNSLEAIASLQFHMVVEYAEKVKRLRLGKNPSKLLIDVSNYVQNHLSEPIDIEKLSQAMYLSRTYLAMKFKKETNQTLTEYIMQEKMDEAKRLLRYSNKPLSTISAYLGFSSQSHFSNVFKKYTKLSPNEYRMKHNN